MNYIDLFSGVGGFALGAYWAGMQFDNHYFSEVEPYAVELYQKRFPDAIPLGDIREIDCEKLADTASKGLERQKPEGERSGESGLSTECSTWLITGGFPCTDISVAGKGAGIIEGKQSGLWFEYWRIIRDLRPRYAIMENVGALTFRGLDVVLGSLAEIGYDAEWQDIRAEDVGAPHRRERIWIVAYPNEHGKSGRTEYEKQGQGKLVPYPERDGRRARRAECEGQQGRVTSNGTGGEMADTSRELFNRGGESGPAGRGESTDGSGEVSDSGCIWQAERRDERLRDATRNEEQRADNRGRAQEYVSGQWWAIEPSVGRLAHGVSHRVDRLKGLGNAIVPQIAELLFRQIKTERK